MRWTRATAGFTLSGMHRPSLVLHRIDPVRNMARFYALSIEPTLLGDLALVRRWGRIGTRGRQRIELHAGDEAARAAYDRAAQAKRRRGYR